MKELRIGLVLYGGVSLAIYMNGISTELWHLLRASKARRDGTTSQLDDTASIYADLLDDLAKLTCNDLRVVVDVIAGTSAGGVNAAVLAKAIVDGGDASILNRVWLEDADISKLRAEPAARAPWYLRATLSVIACACEPVRSLKARVSRIPGVSWEWVRDHLYSMIMNPDGRSTPLDGKFFTQMIAKTFHDMGSGNALLPKRASFDLFVTRTDLQGWPRHLPVSREFHSEPLYEKTHAHVMRFRRKPFGGGLHDDFGLTYAARSTASFPVAFAPTNYDTVKADYVSEVPHGCVPGIDQFARDQFPEHALFGFPVDSAWMVDGGVLDNKPFTHVTQAIEHKPAEHEVYRVVAYVEPDPEPDPVPSDDVSIPKPLQVAANLYGLFRHEPVHEDLCRLRDRNKKVADLNALLDANKEQARRLAMLAGIRSGLNWPPNQADADNWRKATNAFAASAYLSGYPGYVVLKARSAADFLANVTCRALGYPYASRHAYFVRQIFGTWIHELGALKPPEFGTPIGYTISPAQRLLLKAFDVQFCLRRIHALVRATNESYNAARAADRKAFPDRAASLDAFKSTLDEAARTFEALQESNQPIRQLVSDTSGVEDFQSTINEMIAENDFSTAIVVEKHHECLKAIYYRLAEHSQGVSDEQDAKVADALSELPSDRDDSGIGPIREALVAFPFLDLIAYPVLEAANIHELIDIDIMRISPRDVRRNAVPPLKSLDLGAFKGFLDHKAREHDMMWGRHDGAERLLTLVMAAAGAERHDAKAAKKICCAYREKLARAIKGGSKTRP